MNDSESSSSSSDNDNNNVGLFLTEAHSDHMTLVDKKQTTNNKQTKQVIYPYVSAVKSCYLFIFHRLKSSGLIKLLAICGSVCLCMSVITVCVCLILYVCVNLSF